LAASQYKTGRGKKFSSLKLILGLCIGFGSFTLFNESKPVSTKGLMFFYEVKRQFR
jgi:hypothetical protein